MKFFLREGWFYPEQDKTDWRYEKGMVIESETDLVDLVGPQKFERIPDDVPADKPVRAKHVNPQIKKAQEQEMTPEQLAICGPINFDPAKRYKRLYGNQKAVATDSEPTGADAPSAAKITGGAKYRTGINAKVEGRDLTAKFPLAISQDYRVVKTADRLFFVIDPDTDRPVNAKGVAREEVETVIRSAAKVGA